MKYCEYDWCIIQKLHKHWHINKNTIKFNDPRMDSDDVFQNIDGPIFHVHDESSDILDSYLEMEEKEP